VSWVEIQRRWYDTEVLNCELCGRLIPRRVWLAIDDGTRREFCSEECEDLYRNYWLPKYGSRTQAAEGSTGDG
jgi:hypothetical protein